MSKAVAGVAMSLMLDGGVGWLWFTAWVFRDGTFPLRGCRSAKPATLEANAP